LFKPNQLPLLLLQLRLLAKQVSSKLRRLMAFKESNMTLPDTDQSRRSHSLIQKLPKPTLPSMLKPSQLKLLKLNQLPMPLLQPPLKLFTHHQRRFIPLTQKLLRLTLPSITHKNQL
jgi:hypothetical protein